jgi:predicted nucleic acid-binding Zn ribbon protein
MPTYNYICEHHKTKDDQDFVFEVNHGMSQKPEVLCPQCKKPCERTWLGMTFQFYFPGNGMVRDKAGARRSMNLHQLENDDPYGYMRQPGEKADLVDKLRKGGKHQGHPKVIATHGIKKK